jgi:hypothetical protein
VVPPPLEYRLAPPTPDAPAVPGNPDGVGAGRAARRLRAAGGDRGAASRLEKNPRHAGRGAARAAVRGGPIGRAAAAAGDGFAVREPERAGAYVGGAAAAGGSPRVAAAAVAAFPAAVRSAGAADEITDGCFDAVAADVDL